MSQRGLRRHDPNFRAQRDPRGAQKPSTTQEKRRGSSRNGWKTPSTAQIEQDVRDSRLVLRVALDVDVVEIEEGPANPFSGLKFDKRPRFGLLECGINKREELVEFQRVVASLSRPTRTSEAGGVEEATLAFRTRVIGSTGQYVLEISPRALDTLWKFTTTLVLRLQSLGLPVLSLMKEGLRITLGAVSRDGVQLSGQLQWQSLTVLNVGKVSSTRLTQKVLLSKVKATVEVDLSSVRNRALIELVDEMIAQHTDSNKKQVVILRGIPGSGKSSLGREISMICQIRGVGCTICSADPQFETPRGYVFDPQKLSLAHDSCKERFQHALTNESTAIVVVDNTNTQRWEYEPYEILASESGCGLQILEMRCSNLLTSIRMAQRNSHGVAVVKVMAMFTRWEHDDRAIAFCPQFEHPLIERNPITRNPFNNRVAYVGLFLTKASRAQLLETIQPRHQQVIGEHVTMFYRPTSQYVRQVPIGASFNVRVCEIVEDDRGQAARVMKDPSLLLSIANKVPHITVSTGEGVNAYYSNELLEDRQAKRTLPNDSLSHEFEAQIGVVLMAQNNKIVNVASPLSEQFDQGTSHPHGVGSVVLLILDGNAVFHAAKHMVNGSPLGLQDLKRRIVRHDVVYHHMGAESRCRRVLCIKKTSDSSQLAVDETASAITALLSPSPTHSLPRFDVVTYLPENHCDEDLRDLIKTHLSPQTASMKILTSSVGELSLDLGQDAGRVSIVEVPGVCEDDALARFEETVGSGLTLTLDTLGVSLTEESCSLVSEAIRVIGQVSQELGLGGRVQAKRIDSSLLAMPVSDVATLVLAVQDLAGDEDIAGRFGESLKHRGIEVVSTGDSPTVVHFRLRSNVVFTPLFRLYIVDSNDSQGEIQTRLKWVEEHQCKVRDGLSFVNQEIYAYFGPIIRAIVRAACPNVEEKNLLDLLSEHIALEYLLEKQESTLGFDSLAINDKNPMQTDDDSLWRCISDLLHHLAAWTTDQWRSELHMMACIVGLSAEELPDLLVAQLAAAMEENIKLIKILDEKNYLSVLSALVHGANTSYIHPALALVLEQNGALA
ncbi:hypothetical protein Poli38472_004425 [Pythium oligandrum]|uniref:tRNA ligase phosphodiesterase domain-containing protein n=1 Tax=Pythium oligandrum TaxID=41045 RepID=A0A8K1FEF1_PYTOL|nr:hypothetical protein Poli38472_004425 [Pythium oligandrum]|eukprot:TMW59356.1 hypothetical protein Poli38472_004425 [Pythium oligandrum]